MGNSVSEQVASARCHANEGRFPAALAALASIAPEENEEKGERKTLAALCHLHLAHWGTALRLAAPESPLAQLASMKGREKNLVRVLGSVGRCCALVEALCKTGQVGRAQWLARRLLLEVAGEGERNEAVLALVVSLSVRCAPDEMEEALRVLDELSRPLSQRALFYRCVLLGECGECEEAVEASSLLTDSPRHALLRARLCARAKRHAQSAALYESCCGPGNAEAAASSVVEFARAGRLGDAVRVFSGRFVAELPERLAVENAWDREEQAAINDRVTKLAPLFGEIMTVLCGALFKEGQNEKAESILNQWRTITLAVKYEDDVALCKWGSLTLMYGKKEDKKAQVERAMLNAIECYTLRCSETDIRKAPATRELLVLLALLCWSSGEQLSSHWPQLARAAKALQFEMDASCQIMFERYAYC